MPYFDHCATAPPDPALMTDYTRNLETYWMNPAAPYRAALDARRQMADALRRMADRLHTSADGWIVTSGATESLVTALRGTLRQRGDTRLPIAGFEGDHAATQTTLTQIARDPRPVRTFPLTPQGVPDADALETAFTADPAWARTLSLLTVLWVNNETGAVADLPRIRRLLDTHAPEALLHVDAVQAPGRVPLDLRTFRPDLLTLSGHKLGAPRGVGLLYVKPGTVLQPLMVGGGQQHKRRGGTENAPLTIAMADAVVRADAGQRDSARHAAELRALLLRHLAAHDLPTRIHTDDAHGVPHILSAAFPIPRAETLIHLLEADGFYLSASSACTTRDGDSHVLTAMGVPKDLRAGTLRISFAPTNTSDEVTALAAALARHTAWLRDALG